MQAIDRLTQDLRSIVAAVVAENQSREQLNRLVTVCHSLCVAILKYKIAFAMLESRFHYSSYRDLAFDVIGELFRQDEQGRLTKLKGYFEGVSIEDIDDAEILSHLRRLVHSRVNQEIFRIYAEVDPPLAKVLRNIKLAIRDLDSFVVTSRAGEWYMTPAMTEANQQLAVIEAEDLQRAISGFVSGNERIPDLLAKLSNFLRTQETFARSVPVMTVAIVFRALISRSIALTEGVYPEPPLLAQDTLNIITDICSKVKKQMEHKYVERKKLPADLFNAYFTSIQETMVQRFLGEDGSEASYYDRLSAIRPDITYAEYYKNHRSTFEYLARVTDQKISRELRKEYED